jgi:predicted HicB family RNase H-like nuclease
MRGMAMIEYKGYRATVDFDGEARVFYGEVIDLNDVITFQGESVKELEQAFHDSVDDYLEFCKERGEKPEKPFSGKFVVRISPDLHRAITLCAAEHKESVNTYVRDVLEEAVETERKQVTSSQT